MIIIDMEMPKTCNECPCSYFTEGASSDYCQVKHKDFDKETEGKTNYGLSNGVYTRQKWCPLKESEDNEKVGMAIKNGTPLEQTDGDLISRQAVIDMLNRLIEVERKQGTDVMNYGRERVNAYESILDEIESDYLFPSITSAEKTDSSIPQEDVAGILNTVESALKGTNYEVVGYDNTDGFLKVLIDVK